MRNMVTATITRHMITATATPPAGTVLLFPSALVEGIGVDEVARVAVGAGVVVEWGAGVDVDVDVGVDDMEVEVDPLEEDVAALPF